VDPEARLIGEANAVENYMPLRSCGIDSRVCSVVVLPFLAVILRAGWPRAFYFRSGKGSGYALEESLFAFRPPSVCRSFLPSATLAESK
jgi:hypothetical protein